MNSTASPKEYSEKEAEQKALIACRYGFEDIRYKLFKRTRILSAKEYIFLLSTYSDHIALKEDVRTEFFSEIERVINNYGGKITINDTIDLQLAKKSQD